MGRREEKGRAVARYLTGRTGIPFIRWEQGRNIDAPYPYKITLVTEAKIEGFREALNTPRSGLNIVVRYDGFIDNIDNAWVGMSLQDFVYLLQAHYESNKDRIANKEG